MSHLYLLNPPLPEGVLLAPDGSFIKDNHGAVLLFEDGYGSAHVTLGGLTSGYTLIWGEGSVTFGALQAAAAGYGVEPDVSGVATALLGELEAHAYSDEIYNAPRRVVPLSGAIPGSARYKGVNPVAEVQPHVPISVSLVGLIGLIDSSDAEVRVYRRGGTLVRVVSPDSEGEKLTFSLLPGDFDPTDPRLLVRFSVGDFNYPGNGYLHVIRS